MKMIMLHWPDKLFSIFRINILILLLFFLVIGCGFSKNLRESQFSGGVSSPQSYLIGEDGNRINSIDQKKMDIIFVVDTAYPMIHHLEQVHHSFAGFLNELSSASWQMAFTNTDYDSSEFEYYRRDLFEGRWINLELEGQVLTDRVLYSNSDQKEKIFIDTLKRYNKGDVSTLSDQNINPCDLPPYCQGQISNPLHSLMMSVAINQYHFRKDADFVGIIFSNEDESTPVGADFLQRLNRLLHKNTEKQKNIKIFSISIVPDDRDCLQSNQNMSDNFGQPAYADSILEIIKATKGRMISICSSNFSPLAKAIADVL